jgi:hypothetical protein
LEDLIAHTIGQFNSTLKTCVELILSGRRSFDFVRPLLENHIANIKSVAGMDRASPHMARLVRLEQLSVDMCNLNSADVLSVAQAAVPLMRAEQIRLQEEVSKRIADQTALLQEMESSYEKSLEEYDSAVLTAKSAEDTMRHAQETIAKAQALLRANEKILEQERKKMEEIGARNFQMQAAIRTQFSSLEGARAEQAERQPPSDEELREKAMANAMEIRQRELALTRAKIMSLVNE